MEDNPHYRDLLTRITPFLRTSDFCNTFQPYPATYRDAGSNVDLKDVHLLVMQFLEANGYLDTLAILREESGITDLYPTHEEAAIIQHIRQAMRNVHTLYNLTLSKNADLDMVDIDDHLYNMDLLDASDDTFQKYVNIWDEKNPATIIYSNDKDDDEMDKLNHSKVKAASLNRLVIHLTSKGSDAKFMACLLMTYQSFTTPQRLLAKLIERYDIPSNVDTNVKVVQLQVINVLKHWIKNYPSDFNSEMKREIRCWISTLDSPAHALAIKGALEHKVVSRTKQFDHNPPKPHVDRSIFSHTLKLADIHPDEVARQVTLYQHAIYRSIRASEMLNLAWSKPKYRHRAPNLLKMIAFFNRLSSWAKHEIMQYAALANRVRAMTYLIKLAEQFLRLNNFDGTMAIHAALNSASVHRLKHTTSRIPSQVMEKRNHISTVLSREHGFKNYNVALSQANPPCIPYLGFSLTHLTFIDENPTFIENKGQKLVMFSKCVSIYNVISSLQQYQFKPFNFYYVDQIACLLESLPTIEETVSYQHSLEYEPRGSLITDIE